MKKILVILLLMVYGSSTMGAIIHLHYCMNEFVGWSLWHSDDNKCGKCGMKEKKGGCCKDEHKQIKLTTAHQKTASQYLQLLEVPALVPTSENIYINSIAEIEIISIPGHSPPAVAERFYILHCVFRI